MGETNRMYRWRNVLCPDSEADSAIREIDAYEDSLVDKPEEAEHIRALISRIDPLSHYKSFENLNFILDAIGAMDYERMPAVDVLWRHGQIDEKRTQRTRNYIQALTLWLNGEQPVADGTELHDLYQQIKGQLGEISDSKRWLVMSLRKTLQEYVFTPFDVIDSVDDATFVISVYQALLNRPPSPDDLQFRINELEAGKTRSDFIDEIMVAGEYKMHQHYHIAHIIKNS